jgi:hypothetical protein
MNKINIERKQFIPVCDELLKNHLHQDVIDIIFDFIGDEFYYNMPNDIFNLIKEFTYNNNQIYYNEYLHDNENDILEEMRINDYIDYDENDIEVYKNLSLINYHDEYEEYIDYIQLMIYKIIPVFLKNKFALLCNYENSFAPATNKYILIQLKNKKHIGNILNIIKSLHVEKRTRFINNLLAQIDEKDYDIYSYHYSQDDSLVCINQINQKVFFKIHFNQAFCVFKELKENKNDIMPYFYEGTENEKDFPVLFLSEDIYVNIYKNILNDIHQQMILNKYPTSRMKEFINLYINDKNVLGDKRKRLTFINHLNHNNILRIDTTLYHYRMLSRYIYHNDTKMNKIIKERINNDMIKYIEKYLNITCYFNINADE